MHQIVPTIYNLFWVRYHPSKVYSQKKSHLETKYRPIFPPPPNHTLWIHWPWAHLFCIGWVQVGGAPLSSVFVFFHSHAVSVVADWFCLILLHVFSPFFDFFFFLIHTFPVANTFCCPLFLFIMFLYISFHSYRFIQKDLGLCGPNSVYWIKGY